MPSLEYKIDELSQVGSTFIEEVNDELKRALATEKNERKVTQQSIADTLGVDRSVVNRRFMGLENLTARTIAETLWAIGWEPHFEARKIVPEAGANEPIQRPKVTISTGSISTTFSCSIDPVKFSVRAG
jgi:hypothetical protein